MTLDPFWVSFLLKILVTAAVVIAAARAAEWAGPFFGALIACLPVSAGPSYVLLSLQASDGFIAETALASAAMTAGAAIYLATYVLLARLGGRVAAATMAGAVRAMPGFALGLVVLHELALPAGAPLAMLAALATMLAWSAGLILWRVWRPRARAL